MPTQLNGSLAQPGASLRRDELCAQVIYLPNTSMPDMPQNLKRVYAPPSPLQPTTTLRSEAMASLRAEVGIEKAIQADSLRMQGAVLCRLGVEHQRKGTPCEDVPFWGEPGRFQVRPTNHTQPVQLRLSVQTRGPSQARPRCNILCCCCCTFLQGARCLDSV